MPSDVTQLQEQKQTKGRVWRQVSRRKLGARPYDSTLVEWTSRSVDLSTVSFALTSESVDFNTVSFALTSQSVDFSAVSFALTSESVDFSTVSFELTSRNDFYNTNSN